MEVYQFKRKSEQHQRQGQFPTIIDASARFLLLGTSEPDAQLENSPDKLIAELTQTWNETSQLANQAVKIYRDLGHRE